MPHTPIHLLSTKMLPWQEQAIEKAREHLGSATDERTVIAYFDDVIVGRARARRVARVYCHRFLPTGVEPRLKRSAPLGAPPSRKMLAIGYVCAYCREPATTIDHVWPRSRGGDDHPNNRVRACGICNSVKASRSIINDECPSCGKTREPGDVETSTGTAFYACRCGHSWQRAWDLQTPSL